MTRLLIIAADPLVRSALGGMVTQTETLTVVGQASPTDDPAETLNVYRPDVILADAGWAFSIADLVQMIEEWSLPILLLMPEADEPVGALLSAGFGGILPRTVDADRLEAAVQAVVQNLTVVDPAFLEGLESSTSNASANYAAIAEIEPLTPREFDVLELLADGLTNREIAVKLGISHHTVKFHLTALMDKLDVHSRTEAVTKASRAGILEI